MKVLSFDVGIVNLAYCIIEKNGDEDPRIKSNNGVVAESSPTILYWEIIELSKKGNTFSAHIATSGIAELYLTLINQLDQRPHLRDVDIVLIEKQPSFNPKMRIIAGCLQTYFYIRGVVDKPTDKIRSVEFFSPKHKLKCYDGPELDISSKNGKIVKGKYAQTKKMGVAIAKTKLEEYNESSQMIQVFENSKKKDDLSDCYLQALTYLMFKQRSEAALPRGSKDQRSGKEPQKRGAPKPKSKASLKKELKEYLDSRIKNCSVMEIMNKEYQNINELEFPMEIPESMETLLPKLNLKKYLNMKYN